MKVIILVAILSLTISNMLVFELACNLTQTHDVSLNSNSNVNANTHTNTNANVNANANAKGAENLPMNTPQDNVKWTPTEYVGLLAGKSTYEDVKKLFGKPRWEGSNDEKAFESDSELEILLQYSGNAKGKESIEVVTGEETKIVKAFSVRPYPGITKQEAITKFGPDYFEIGSGESMCITGNKKGPSEKKLEFPMMLVYPNKGMYVLIDEDNKVNHFGFTYKCAD